jgi:hypothetical protein
MVLALTVIFLISATQAPASESAEAASDSSMPWWGWPLILLVLTFVLGILAVLGGVGGGVLFVPIVGGFFPFHLDFVSGAGLLVALAGALAAGPGLLRKGLADLRLAIPVALVASTFAIIGALAATDIPQDVRKVALGLVILGIVGILALAKKSEYPNVQKSDRLSEMLRITGIYREESTGEEINWKIHRTPVALLLFTVIGFMAGMFGLGAGWANVPVLNLVMGAPLKVSVATSKFLLSITDTSAAWIYFNKGAVLPMMVIPSIVGIMLGSLIGVRILAKTKPAAVRYIVITLLGFAGLRSLLAGLGIV